MKDPKKAASDIIKALDEVDRQEVIKKFRTFFTITVAAFEFQHLILKAVIGKPTKSTMHILHLIAKQEMDRDKPDLKVIDKLLIEMETEAKEYENSD